MKGKLTQPSSISIAATALLLVLALVFASCQQSGKSGKTLTLAINSGVEGDALKQAVKDYEAPGASMSPS